MVNHVELRVGAERASVGRTTITLARLDAGELQLRLTTGRAWASRHNSRPGREPTFIVNYRLAFATRVRTYHEGVDLPAAARLPTAELVGI